MRWGSTAPSARRTPWAFEHNTLAGRPRPAAARCGDERRRAPQPGRACPSTTSPAARSSWSGCLGEALARLAACLTALDRAQAAGSGSTPSRPVCATCARSRDDAWQLPQLERELARARRAPSRALPACRCGWPTRGPCCRPGWRAPDPCQSRTGTLTVLHHGADALRCRTAWSAWSASTTASSRAAAGRRGRRPRPRPARRRARRPRRGPAALLDALLAAGERLVITYTGATEQSGAERPPAVPPRELLDAPTAPNRRTRPGRGRGPPPLQSYDVRNHEPGALRRPGPFSFDRASLAGARPASASAPPAPPFLAGPLPPAPTGDVSLADLRQLLHHPARTFCGGASTSPRRSSPTRSPTRSRCRSTAWRCGRSATGCCARCSPATTRGHGPGGDDGRAAARHAPPFDLGRGALTKVARSARSCSPAAARCAWARRAASTWTSTSAAVGG